MSKKISKSSKLSEKPCKSKSPVGGTEPDATPFVPSRKYLSKPSLKTLNVVKIDEVNNGVLNIGNRYVTNTFRTLDHSDYGGASSSATRRQPLPVICEEIMSCTLPLSVKNKYHIADNIGSNWRRLARNLPDANFTDAQLDNIKAVGERPEEVVFNVLTRWGEVAPSSATVGNLATALENIKLNHLATGLKPK